MAKKENIKKLFDNIASDYDKLNHILSLNIDKGWRKKAVKETIDCAEPMQVLDVACGTGDFTIEIARKAAPGSKITGIDLSEGMMKIGREKIKAAGVSADMVQGDCEALPYADGTFDRISVGFGVRNFEHLDKSLGECLRVLRSGGHLVILELSRPVRFPMKQLYSIYERCIMPLFGRLLLKDSKAFDYLPASIEAFPQGEVMQKALEKAGFGEVSFRRMTGGVCTLYIATKL